MPKKRGPTTRSAYQTHVSILFPEAKSESNIIDITERKLVFMATKHSDENVRKLAARLLHDYLRGIIAIAWENGTVPVYCFLKP